MSARLAICGAGMQVEPIVIDGRVIADHFTGIGRVTYSLVDAIAALKPTRRVLLLYNPAARNTRYDLAGLADAIELVPVNIPLFSPAEQVRMPRVLQRLGAGLYHAPYYARPYIGVACASVVTIYDIIPRRFPHDSPARTRVLWEALNRLAVRASQAVITGSVSARDDLVVAFGIAPERVHVIPNAAEVRFRPQSPEVIAALRTKYNLPEHYLLTLSSNKPHKNLVRLVRAWALLQREERLLVQCGQPRLVIAGHWDARYPDVQRLRHELGLAASVQLLPDVAENDLPALYAGADVFVYPSLYEGFGLPVLEAMACGVPLVCGAHSSLPEVTGAAAVLVDVANPAAIASGLAQLLSDPALRSRLRAEGLQRAQRFSWQRTAAMTLAVYEALLR